MTRRQGISRLRALAPLTLVALCAAGPASGGYPGPVTAADDASHFQQWDDGRHDGYYTEWWYFNVYDEAQDVQAIFTYFVTDPEGLTRHTLSQTAVVAYTPRGIVSELDVSPASSLSASTEAANVEIDSNYIEVVDADTYHIAGESRDGRLSWDLVYVRRGSPWFAADRLKVGKLLAWEQMGWLVAMPRARVTGTLSVDGRAYPISAPGYHDHNWGEWVFTSALWNWAQYSEPGLSVGLGDFIGTSAGIASMDLDGRRTVFTKDQYDLEHTRWAFDRRNLVWYPVETVLRAENDTRRLTVTMTAIDTLPLRGASPPLLPDPIIYEQTARYDGDVWTRGNAGPWVLAKSFHGRGFKEYTARRR